MSSGVLSSGTGRRGWWGAVPVAAAFAALALGLHNLDATSLWHDEAVQVHVAKNLLETGRPLLPSGNFHPVAPAYNVLKAAFMGMFGDSENVVRLPSVLLAALNVILTYLLVRPLLGKPTAAVAAIAMALSPWNVAWSREARFYTMQQTAYLLTLLAAWRMMEAGGARRRAAWAAALVGAYLLGLGTSLHSVMFLTPLTAYAFVMAAHRAATANSPEYPGRPGVLLWSSYGLIAVAAAVVTMVIYRLTLPQADADAIFKGGQLGLQFSASETSVLFYFDWLHQNLGWGLFILAIAGTALMTVREGRRGLYAALGFWVPVLALSFLLGYRLHRFTFFAHPLYVAAFSYAAVAAAQWLISKLRFRRHEPAVPPLRRYATWAIAFVIVVFGARMSVSAVKLLESTLRTSAGANITLAACHPQWREPCAYVKERLQPGDVVVASTYVVVLYYIGRVDNWYPSRHFEREVWETGSAGLSKAEELEAYVAENPRGYLLVEKVRFWHFDPEHPDVAWVNVNMTLMDKASSEDVRLYTWGMS